MIELVIQNKGSREWLIATLFLTVCLGLALGANLIWRTRKPIQVHPPQLFRVGVVVFTVCTQGLLARWPGARVEFALLGGLDIIVSALIALGLLLMFALLETLLNHVAHRSAGIAPLRISLGTLFGLIAIGSGLDYALGSILPWRKGGLDAPFAVVDSLRTRITLAARTPPVGWSSLQPWSSAKQFWTLEARPKATLAWIEERSQPWSVNMRLLQGNREILSGRFFFSCGRWEAASMVIERGSRLLEKSVTGTPLEALRLYGGVLPWNTWTSASANIQTVSPVKPTELQTATVQTTDGVTWTWIRSAYSQSYQRFKPNELMVHELCIQQGTQ